MTALGALAPYLAGYGNSVLHFNLGPGDLAYLEGFEPMWEIDPDGRATHWTSYESTIRLPLNLRGGRANLTFLFSRVYGQTAEVEIRVNGVTADAFRARGGAYVERSFELPQSVLEASPLTIEIQADSHERRNRGLRMDWLELEATDARSRYTPVGRTVLWSALLSAVFALLVLVTFEPTVATVAGTAVPVALALYGSLAGSFPLAHMVSSIGPFTLAVLVAGIGFRTTIWKSRGGRSGWIPLLTVVAFLIRAGGVFHPRSYYPDLRAHAAMTRIVGEAGLDFWKQPSHYIAEQGVWTAFAMGKEYAFPFSPVFHAFFAPFGLNLPSTIYWMKLAACLLSALEVPLLFFLGRRLSGDGAAFWAALLGVVAPPAFSRLSFAFLAAIFAHFLDTLVLAAMAARSRENRIPITAVTALLIVSMGSYAGSLINFGLFVPLFGLFLFTVARQRQVAVRLVGGSVLAAAVVLGTIYREFLGVFLSDMAPRFLTSEARAGTWSLGATGLTLAQRYYTFYGFLYLPLISLGAWSFWKRRPPAFVASFISAWAAVFCLLIFFRTGMPDLFMKVKEILWVTPLVCLLGGEALAAAERLRPPWRWAGALYYVGVALYGVSYYAGAIAEKFPLAR